jgi:hypothetical protein
MHYIYYKLCIYLLNTIRNSHFDNIKLKIIIQIYEGATEAEIQRAELRLHRR